MKTCMNISATIWPVLSVAKAIRHSWLNQGYMFNLGLSKSHAGYEPEISLDSLEVSR